MPFLALIPTVQENGFQCQRSTNTDKNTDTHQSLLQETVILISPHDPKSNWPPKYMQHSYLGRASMFIFFVNSFSEFLEVQLGNNLLAQIRGHKGTKAVCVLSAGSNVTGLLADVAQVAPFTW